MRLILQNFFAIALAFLLSDSLLSAQVGINTDGSDPNTSAILDLKSTDKGLLIPRMTATQRDNISSPVTGLMVYVTDDNSFYFFNGSGWQVISVGNQIADADNDTKIQVEESADEDIIRFDLGGTERWLMQGARLENRSSGGSLIIGQFSGLLDDLSGNKNNFLGHEAGRNSTGTRNTFTGHQAGRSNTTGSYNLFSGYEAGELNTTGDRNVYLGADAGYNNIAGSNNVFIGNNAGFNEMGSNKLFIDNSATSSPLIYGEFDNDFVKINGQLSSGAMGVGTDAPSKSLELVENADTVQMALLVRNKSGIDTGGSAVGIGFHVEPQANREPKAAIVHERLGNYGRGSFHFLLNNSANTNGVDLNDAKVTITQDGEMGIGTTTPSAALDVVGDLELNGTLNINSSYSFPTADGTNGQILTTDGAGSLAWSNQVTDNLGNHTATQNIQLDGNFISNDGDNEGISIGSTGGLTVKSASTDNRPALFDTDYNGGVYIEVNNSSGTRALFGPSGVGFGGGADNNVNLANWSDGGLNFYTNAAKHASISSTGLFEIFGNLKAYPGGAPNGSSVEISSPGGDLGLVLNRGNGSGGIAHRWDLKIESDNSFDLRSSTTSNGMNIATDGTVNINKLKITGGSPAEGKVLTTDADGDIVLEEPAERIVYIFDESAVNVDGNAYSGWVIVSDYSDALSVSSGDVVTIRVAFSAEIVNGSGTDNLRFRVFSYGGGSCGNDFGGETAELDIFQDNRGRATQNFVQHTFTATCNGTYQFALQTDFTNVDDDVTIDQIQITAVKY